MTQKIIPKHLKTILNEPKQPKIKSKITQNKPKQSRTPKINSKTTQIDKKMIQNKTQYNPKQAKKQPKTIQNTQNYPN